MVIILQAVVEDQFETNPTGSC